MADINSDGNSGGPGAQPERPAYRASSRDSAATPQPVDDKLVGLVELLFFAYRDFTGEADAVLAKFGFGRAHHRVLHFVSRNPGIRVAAWSSGTPSAPSICSSCARSVDSVTSTMSEVPSLTRPDRSRRRGPAARRARRGGVCRAFSLRHNFAGRAHQGARSAARRRQQTLIDLVSRFANADQLAAGSLGICEP